MVKRNLIANYLGQGWSSLISLMFVPLYIKYLGMEAYGLIGLFASLTTWLNILDMGLRPTLGREMARYVGGTHTAKSIRDLLRSIELITLGIVILIATLTIFGAPWMASSWLQAEKLSIQVVAQAFAIMGLVTALRFAEGIYRSSIVGLQRQVLLNVIHGSLSTLRALGAIGVLSWISPTIQAYFIWQAVISLISLGLFAGATYACLPRIERRARFSVGALQEVWRFATGMLGITFLAMLLSQSDKFLLSKLLSLKEYGYYTLAASVAGVLYMIVTPITQALYPRLCELYATKDAVSLASMYHKGSQLASVLAGSVAIVLMLFAENFLRLWTQDSSIADHVAPLLSMLILGNLLNALYWVPYQTQLAHGWTALTVRVNMVAVFVIVPAILWVTPRYGAVGAAWVWASLNTVYLLIGVSLMHRRILTRERLGWYIRDLIFPLGTGFVATIMVKLIWPFDHARGSDFVLLLVAGTVSLGGTALTANEVRKLLVSSVKELWKRWTTTKKQYEP